MPQGDSLGQVLIQPQGPAQRPGDLADLQGMGQPGAVVVPLRGKEHLGFVGQPPEGIAVQDPVSIPLERGAHGTFFLGALPTAGFIGEGCPGRKDLVLQGLLLLSNGHIVSPWWVISVQNANSGGIGGLFRVANPSTSIIRNRGGRFLPVWANFFEKFLFSCFWPALPGGTAPFLRVPLGTIFVGEPRARAQVHTPRRRPARTRTRRGFLQIGDLCIYWLICGGLAAGGFSMKKAGKRILIRPRW